MRTNSHAHKPERVALPRRLVPRRPTSRALIETLVALTTPPVARFCVGDMIEFEGPDGWHRFVTLLGIKPCGSVDLLVYDGQPHYLASHLTELNAVRILKLERMEPWDVASYRRQLGLDTQIEVAA